MLPTFQIKFSELPSCCVHLSNTHKDTLFAPICNDHMQMAHLAVNSNITIILFIIPLLIFKNFPMNSFTFIDEMMLDNELDGYF